MPFPDPDGIAVLYRHWFLKKNNECHKVISKITFVAL